MNNIDIIRRMDDLGRIVIPKEVRRILKISSNEPLKITIENDKLVMKKYSILNEFDNLVKKYGKIIRKITSKNVVITNRDKVVYSNIENFNDKEINDTLKSKIINREELNGLFNMEIIDGKSITSYYYSKLIIINSEICGIIMIFSDTNNIVEEDKTIIKIVNEILDYSL